MSDHYFWKPPQRPAVPIRGEASQFPVRRIFCVGRNYGGHVREMGGDPERDLPVFFTKPADSLVQSGSRIPFPLACTELHHEVELVVALDKPLCNATSSDAEAAVFGLAVGIDLTRRDLQRSARKQGLPWDTAKAFDQSAPMAAICRCRDRTHISSGEILLRVNGEIRQSSNLQSMIWTVPQILVHLSRLFHLQPGDLVFTGTPDGVGPLVHGDTVHASISGLEPLEIQIVSS